MNKERMNCLCGKSITKNTFKKHLKLGKCNVDDEKKQEIIYILELKTKHQFAWLKKDEKNAVGDIKWYLSVINNETKIDDWTFEPPRKKGENTPRQYEKNSLTRHGDSNPVNRARLKEIDFTKDEVLDYGRCLLYQLIEEDCGLGETFCKLLQDQFPNWAYLFSAQLLQASEGSSRFKMLRPFFDGTDDELRLLLIKRRGRMISIGQKKSKKFYKVASKLAANMGFWRITEPQKILYLLISSIDQRCKMEVPYVNKSKTYSFDMYSPQIDGYIEMHGRFWHDNLDDKYGKPYEMVKHNLENDLIKENIIKTDGHKHIIFWDDRIELWLEQIKEIYGEQSKITIEEAKDKVNSVDWSSVCIRYRSSR